MSKSQEKFNYFVRLEWHLILKCPVELGRFNDFDMAKSFARECAEKSRAQGYSCDIALRINRGVAQPRQFALRVNDGKVCELDLGNPGA